MTADDIATVRAACERVSLDYGISEPEWDDPGLHAYLVLRLMEHVYASSGLDAELMHGHPRGAWFVQCSNEPTANGTTHEAWPTNWIGIIRALMEADR